MNKLVKVLPVVVALLLVSMPALADGGAADAESWKGFVGLGSGLAVGLAALGCGLAQGRLADGALQGMARNPQAGGFIRTSMMIALAFPESLVLFCFAIAFLLLGKI